MCPFGPHPYGEYRTKLQAEAGESFEHTYEYASTYLECPSQGWSAWFWLLRFSHPATDKDISIIAFSGTRHPFALTK